MTQRRKNFQALRHWATKEMKLNQAKHMGHLEPGHLLAGNVINHVSWTHDDFKKINGGICAALVGQWLGEKIHSSNSLFSRRQKTFRQGKTDQVPGIMRSAAPIQIAYTSTGNEKSVLDANGLRFDDSTDFTGLVEVRPDAGFSPIIQIAPSFSAICRSTQFRQGTGLYIGLKVSTTTGLSGHAVGAYKSRGGHLYFFDPNVGIYKVHRSLEFLDEWVRAYSDLGHDVSMSGNTNDGFKSCVGV
ncbi:hypothetical protein [Roseomonas sp. WA12]